MRLLPLLLAMTRLRYVLLLNCVVRLACVIYLRDELSCGAGARILVAEPHLPSSIATRENSTICPQAMIDEGKTGASDHDFICVNFTPSVNVIVDIKAPSSTADVGEAFLFKVSTGVCMCVCLWRCLFSIIGY
jgi:hypothetical protein